MNYSKVNEAVEAALKEKHTIPDFNIKGDVPPFQELGKIVDVLLERGYKRIENHYLPLPDLPIIKAKEFYEQNKKDYISKIRMVQYSESQAKLYIFEFFKYLEICYKEFVDYFFPTFKNEFSFYNSIPHEYIFYINESIVPNWGMLGHRSSRTGKIEIYFKNIEERKEAFGKENLKCLRTFSLDSILRMNDFARFPVKTFDGINASKVDEYCVIRNWIYKLLNEDMEELFKENKD